jgi:hypothetical protein
MSGEMRRPPQLWEQRLARTTSVIAAGVSSGEATAIVTPTPPPGTDSGVEPSPVLPPPGDFIAPSQPTLISSVQGINVVWNGLNSAGDLWPSDTSYVEIHMDTTGPTFTLGTATLKGRLARPGGLAVTGLSRGTTYYFRLRGADAAGNVTDASTAGSAQPGQIEGPDIAANAITANSIVAGTITGWSINSAYLSGGTVSGGYITGGTVNGGYITGGTVNGSLVQSSSGAARIVLNTGDTLDFYSSNVKRGDLFGVTVDGLNGIGVTGALDVSSTIYANGLDITSSTVDMLGVYNNSTTGLDNVGITTAGRLRRLASTQDIKYDMAALSGTLDQSVDADRQLGVATVTPTDILDLAVVEFSVIDEDEPTERRVLGFIAEDVAAKFPIAASRNDDGSPAGVLEGSVLAALLAVVQQQHDEITDLRARIEALEA